MARSLGIDLNLPQATTRACVDGMTRWHFTQKLLMKLCTTSAAYHHYVWHETSTLIPFNTKNQSISIHSELRNCKHPINHNGNWPSSFVWHKRGQFIAKSSDLSIPDSSMSADNLAKLSLGASPATKVPSPGSGQIPNPAQNLALGSLNAARGKPPPLAAPSSDSMDPAVLARISMVCFIHAS